MAEDTKPEFPRQTSSFNGSRDGFTVEARYVGVRPISFGRQIFDKEWRRIEFEAVTHGVPVNSLLLQAELLNHTAAEALRWLFLAQVEAEYHHIMGFETRLITHKAKFTHTVEAIGVAPDSEHRG